MTSSHIDADRCQSAGVTTSSWILADVSQRRAADTAGKLTYAVDSGSACSLYTSLPCISQPRRRRFLPPLSIPDELIQVKRASMSMMLSERLQQLRDRAQQQRVASARRLRQLYSTSDCLQQQTSDRCRHDDDCVSMTSREVAAILSAAGPLAPHSDDDCSCNGATPVDSDDDRRTMSVTTVDGDDDGKMAVCCLYDVVRTQHQLLAVHIPRLMTSFLVVDDVIKVDERNQSGHVTTKLCRVPVVDHVTCRQLRHADIVVEVDGVTVLKESASRVHQLINSSTNTPVNVVVARRHVTRLPLVP